MADQQLNIRLNAIDNTSKAFSSIKDSVFNLRNALLGLGTGLAVKSIYDLGVIVSDVKDRLNEASKAGYGGSQAFDQLTKFAFDAKISLVEVLKASQDLLRISKSPEELAKTLQIVANISAFTGLSFQTSADQLAKAYTKGIDSSREFTASNIKNLREFSSFADTSIGRLPDLFDSVFGANGSLGKANENVKRGLSGTIITLGNTFDDFKIKVAQNFFGELEKQLGNLSKFLVDNKTKIFEFGEVLGKGFANAIIAVSNLLVFLKDNLDKIVFLIGAFVGYKIIEGILLLVETFKIFNKELEITYALLSKIDKSVLLTGFGKVLSVIGLATQAQQAFLNKIDATKKSVVESSNDWMDYLSHVEATKEKTADLLQVWVDIKTTNQQAIETLKDLTRVTDTLSTTIIEGLNKGIKDFSKSIAESIVLGKSLTESFKALLQNILIRMLATEIELLLRQGLKIALKQVENALGIEGLLIEKEKTKELEKQAKIIKTGNEGTGTTEEGIFDRVKAIFEKISSSLSEAFQSAFDYATSIFDNIGNYVNEIFSNIGGSVSDILSNLSGSIGDIFNSIGGSLGDILGSIGGGGNGGGGDFLSTLFDLGSTFFGFAEGGKVKAGVPITVGERGRELFIPSTNGTIVPNQNIGTGNMNINFTINATDVRGVQELLINNRATITNLVNQALNQRGKSSIVWVEHFQVVQKPVQYL